MYSNLVELDKMERLHTRHALTAVFITSMKVSLGVHGGAAV